MYLSTSTVLDPNPAPRTNNIPCIASRYKYGTELQMNLSNSVRETISMLKNVDITCPSECIAFTTRSVLILL